MQKMRRSDFHRSGQREKTSREGNKCLKNIQILPLEKILSSHFFPQLTSSLLISFITSAVILKDFNLAS